MPTYPSLQSRQQTLIRKALDWSLFLRPYATTNPITAITDASGLLALPAGYADIGFTSKSEGATWTRDQDISDTESYGVGEPTRRDYTKDVAGLQFTAQESKKRTLELSTGIDLTAVTKSGTTGEVTFDKPSKPQLRYWNTLALAKDGDGADTLYLGKWLPRASVTDVAEEKWQEDAELSYGITMTAFLDPATGTSVRYFWGGPAMLASVGSAMGF